MMTESAPPAPPVPTAEHLPSRETGSPSIQEINAAVNATSQWLPLLKTEMRRVIIGQEYLVDRLLVGALGRILAQNRHIFVATT